ncbi:MAG: polyketide cyclase [Sphingomonas bacterium]|uniref:nuclear transport factor 2 family protein n=1 Tax=Sphingomonas bacterium TaxID=1895847 RepID=UPI002605E711|nr:nuclear transport factor 2 family protein [Sphingomonas bacterium]MDB5709423.1 polyketide cyclase [Sphingomonas bacterium]
MTDPKYVAELYLASWNAVPAARAAAMDIWSATATYRDPLMAGNGRDGIASMIDAAVANFPGHHFVLDGTPDGHGPFVRFSWAIRPIAGADAAVARGTDVVRLDGDGRIAEVIGFLDGAAA